MFGQTETRKMALSLVISNLGSNIPCPSMGPKLSWTVQIVFDGPNLFWSWKKWWQNTATSLWCFMCQKHISSRTSTHYPQIKELWSVEFYLVSYIFLILLILLHVFLPRTSQAQICVVLKRKNDDKIPQHHDDALCGKSTLVVGSLRERGRE